MYPHRFGVPSPLPFAPTVLEVSDEYLLLRFDRDHRLAPLMEGARLLVAVGELGVTVGMLGAFLGLARALQAVVQRVGKSAAV